MQSINLQHGLWEYFNVNTSSEELGDVKKICHEMLFL